jgi:hypothetical protein
MAFVLFVLQLFDYSDNARVLTRGLPVVRCQFTRVFVLLFVFLLISLVRLAGSTLRWRNSLSSFDGLLHALSGELFIFGLPGLTTRHNPEVNATVHGIEKVRCPGETREQNADCQTVRPVGYCDWRGDRFVLDYAPIALDRPSRRSVNRVALLSDRSRMAV